MERQRLEYLLHQYAHKCASDNELEELNQFGLKSPENRALLTELLTEGFLMHHEPDFDTSYYDDLAAKAIAIDKEMEIDAAPALKRVVSVKRRWYWAAASTAAVLITIGIFMYSQQRNAKTIARSNNVDIPAPITSRATITLSNGRQVFLDSVSNGQLVQQGNVKLVKLAEGAIAYQRADGENSNELQYNTLTNPKGSLVIDLNLADGSHIWLNAGSSITYPVAFSGNERNVELKGEGYFEIAKNSSKPFVVKVGESAVTVLGTSFNIMAYSNESVIQTTLVEGAVKVAGDANSVILKPGEQSQLNKNGRLAVVKNADIELVTSWKSGHQIFKNADIPTIMRKIERWYNVEVDYQTEVSDAITFSGDLPRNVNLSELLKLFEQDSIHFKIDANERKVTIAK